jgi:hypothetical protein
LSGNDLLPAGPNYPFATPGVRIKFGSGGGWTFLAAALNSNPAGPATSGNRNPNPQLRDPSGTSFNFSSAVRHLDRDFATLAGAPRPIRDYEAVLELTYQAQITPWWQLQPDFDYVSHPGANTPNPNDVTGRTPIKDAAVFGLRAIISFSRSGRAVLSPQRAPAYGVL